MRRRVARSRYCTPSGQPVPLGAELGRGRSGVVYRHGSNARRAVKLWHAPSNDDAVRLRAMLEVLFEPRPAGRSMVICWPSDAVLDSKGQLVGFVMPAAGGIEPQRLTTFLIPHERELLVKNLRYDILVAIAATLAEAVAYLHRQGVVLGDLNDMNLLISADAVVSVLDCDSMQFAGRDGTTHMSAYYRPEYLAPELVGADLGIVPRSVASDTYALTAILFQLLMGGFHPFAGVVTGGPELTQAERAAAGRFAFGPGATELAPPPGAPPYDVLPGDVGAAFAHTFSRGARADQRVPLDQLASVLRDGIGRLTRCAGRPAHVHPAGLSICPWCQRAGITTLAAPQHAPQPPLQVASAAPSTPVAQIVPPHAVQPPLQVAAAVPSVPAGHVAQPPIVVARASAGTGRVVKPPALGTTPPGGPPITAGLPADPRTQHAHQPSLHDTIRSRRAPSQRPRAGTTQPPLPAKSTPGHPGAAGPPAQAPLPVARIPSSAAISRARAARRAVDGWRPGGHSVSEWAMLARRRGRSTLDALYELAPARVWAITAIVLVGLFLMGALQGCATGATHEVPGREPIDVARHMAAMASSATTPAVRRPGNPDLRELATSVSSRVPAAKGPR